jgi:hypothetical protein
MRHVLAWTAAAVLFIGCSQEPPQPELPALNPVSGTVVRGGKPVAGGVVQFVAEPDRPEFLTNSEVGPDGKFTLSTVRTTDSKGERLPGAPAGKYRVTYMPPVADQTTANLPPITLKNSVAIESSDSDLKIELP